MKDNFVLLKLILKKLTKKEIALVSFLLSFIALMIGLTVSYIINTAIKGLYDFTMVAIIIIPIGVAYKHFVKNDDTYFFSPLIYPLLFTAISIGLMTLFIRIISFFTDIDLNVHGILFMSVIFIIPTFFAYIILKFHLRKQDKKSVSADYGHSNAWFNRDYYIDVFNWIAILFTILAFFMLLQPDSSEKYVFSIMGTFYCFYSILLNTYKFLKNKHSASHKNINLHL